MSGAAIRIEIATNAADGELAAWDRATELLAESLGDGCKACLTRHASPGAALAAPATLVGLSLLGALDAETAFAEVEAAWERCCAQAQEGGRTVFVSTILRHLGDAPSAGTMARLRRLNLLTTRLSQRFGLLVIDIDRVLAHRGALALETDARLSGARGQEAAARLIAHALLSYGLAGVIDDDALDRAIAASDAGMGAGIDQLTVPVQLVPRQATEVGRRQQVHLAARPAFDDRGLKGLLRDLRRGRIPVRAATLEIGRKILSRVPAPYRPRTRSD